MLPSLSHWERGECREERGGGEGTGQVLIGMEHLEK